MGDSAAVKQFLLDREFDDFPLQDGFVHPLPDGRVEIWHDWLAGIGVATLDTNRRLLTYSGARSTYKVEVHRVAELPDVETIGARFAATEQRNGGIAQRSVRDTTRSSIGRANFLVDYSRPLARGRVLLGDVIPYDEVWRTGTRPRSSRPRRPSRWPDSRYRSIVAADAGHGSLILEWGTFRWTAPIAVK